MLTIYTKSFCDKCDDIKKRLNDKGVEYLEKNSEEPETLQGLIPLLSNAGLRKKIKAAEEEIRKGNTRSLDEIDKELGIA